MPEAEKPIGPKSIHQEILTNKLKDGSLEIIFQIEVDTDGNAVVTFFKQIETLKVKKPSSDLEDSKE